MRSRVGFIFLPIAAALLLGLACSSSNSGRKVSEQPQPAASTATVARPAVFAAGEVVQVQEHTIVLNRAAVRNGLLMAEFTIENRGNEDVSLSSMLSFQARDADGSKLEQEVFDCGSSSLDGKVLPGDKLKGSICWKATGAGPYRIYYEAALFGSGAVVWEVQ
ncbi:MAG: DUF4352 domain-containing protein [Anaerolineae bacterium]